MNSTYESTNNLGIYRVVRHINISIMTKWAPYQHNMTKWAQLVQSQITLLKGCAPYQHIMTKWAVWRPGNCDTMEIWDYGKLCHDFLRVSGVTCHQVFVPGCFLSSCHPHTSHNGIIMIISLITFVSRHVITCFQVMKLKYCLCSYCPCWSEGVTDERGAVCH